MTVELSGYHYPNKMALIYLASIETTVGSDVMQTIYEMAEIPTEYRPPPNNYAKAFDFAYLSRVNQALQQIYGDRGERSLASKAGRDSFFNGLTEYGTMLGVSDLALKNLSIQMRVKIGLRGMAEMFNKFTDQATHIKDAGDYVIYTAKPCSACWGRRSDKPLCYGAFIGIIEEGLKWVSQDKKFRIEPVACCAMGDEAGILHVWKEPVEK